MLNIVIRLDSYVEWFLIPEAYDQKQFDALVSLPGLEPKRHMGLWRQWILIACGGKFSGPRTLDEFHGIDGRQADIKVDGNRVYVFSEPAEKTLFNIDDQWYEIYNFDRDKLPWLSWLFKEPGVDLDYLTKQFMDITGATFYTQTPITKAYILKRYHYNALSGYFIPSEVYLPDSELV